jgi:hypothetical protein
MMPLTSPVEIAETETPFVIEHRRTGATPTGFVPGARLYLSASALRETALLRALSDEATRSLLAVLTFLTNNGHIHPTAAQVAEVLGIPEARAGERLRRLLAVPWRGEPLLQRLPREGGLDAFTPSRALVSESAAPPEAEGEVVNLPLPPLPPLLPPEPSHREAILAHSRATYGRPRAEVERIVAEQLGHAIEETLDTPSGEARRRLLALGVPKEEVDDLVAHHPVESILEQIAWLAYRDAKRPARFVVAAIRGNYEPPARVRLERALAEAEIEEAQPSEEEQEATQPSESVTGGNA